MPQLSANAMIPKQGASPPTDEACLRWLSYFTYPAPEQSSSYGAHQVLDRLKQLGMVKLDHHLCPHPAYILTVKGQAYLTALERFGVTDNAGT